MYQCPECGEKTDHLKYRDDGIQSYTAWGSFDNDYEEDDREYGNEDSDEIFFFCPECDFESQRISDFDCEDDDDEFAKRRKLSNQFLQKTIC